MSVEYGAKPKLWGDGLMKYVCGCKQVMGRNTCPIHNKGITEKIVRIKKIGLANQWLQENALMYRGDNASDCMKAAFEAGLKAGIEMPDSHELWAVAQLLPGEGIEDGVKRIEDLLDPHRNGIDINENLPYKVSEVICVKCLRRWIAVRPQTVSLDILECECGEPGYVIETGETNEKA